jgi:hypothetical protein
VKVILPTSTTLDVKQVACQSTLTPSDWKRNDNKGIVAKVVKGIYTLI